MNKTSIVKSLEFSSIIGFGLAYWRYDLIIATTVLMALMTLFVVVAKILDEPLTKAQMISWVVVMVFGGMTVFLKDEAFIKWKPTVINSIFALLLWGSHVIGGKTILERLLASKLKCPTSMLRRLNCALAGYFALGGALNIYIAENFSNDVWVSFKIFGNLALNIIFISGSLYYLRDYLKDIAQSMNNNHS